MMKLSVSALALAGIFAICMPGTAAAECGAGVENNTKTHQKIYPCPLAEEVARPTCWMIAGTRWCDSNQVEDPAPPKRTPKNCDYDRHQRYRCW
jgi:hypothetical protein